MSTRKVRLAKPPGAAAASVAGPLAPGPGPKGLAAASWVAILLALLLFAAGVVAIYDAVVGWGFTSGPAVIGGALEKGQGIEAGQLMLWISIALVVIAIVVFVPACRRRPERAYRVKAATGVYLVRADACRLVEVGLRDVPGVLSVRAWPVRSGVQVDLETTGGDTIEATVRAAAVALLKGLDPPITVSVKARSTRPPAEVKSS